MFISQRFDPNHPPSPGALDTVQSFGFEPLVSASLAISMAFLGFGSISLAILLPSLPPQGPLSMQKRARPRGRPLPHNAFHIAFVTYKKATESVSLVWRTIGKKYFSD